MDPYVSLLLTIPTVCALMKTDGSVYHIKHGKMAVSNKTEDISGMLTCPVKQRLWCLDKCSMMPDCHGVNVYSDGKCEAVLSLHWWSHKKVGATLYHILNECPPGFGYIIQATAMGHSKRPSCYYYVNTRQNQTSAKHVCKGMNSDLVSIETEEEQNHVADIIEQRHTEKGNVVYHWISAEYNKKIESWFWSATGQRITYKNWLPGWPMFDDLVFEEHCVVINQMLQFQWGNGGCHKMYKAVCERPVNFVY